MNNVKNTVATALLAGSLTAYTAISKDADAKTGTFAKVELAPLSTNLLIDTVAAARAQTDTQNPIYTKTFCRMRAANTWSNSKESPVQDNVFALCELNAGYGPLSVGVQERWSAQTSYAALSFLSVNLEGRTKKVSKEQSSIGMSGSISVATNMQTSVVPAGTVLEARVAGSMSFDNDQLVVPDTVELETFTWLNKSPETGGRIYTGIQRPFIGFNLGPVTAGPYAELNQGTLPNAYGAKVRIGE